MVAHARFHLELVFPGRKITEGDIVGVCKRIPGVLKSFQHIGIFHLVDQGIVLDVEPDTETILCIFQLHVLLSV